MIKGEKRAILDQSLLLLSCLVSAFIFRAETFFHPLMPPTDETLYYRMAVDWITGSPLYTNTFDHKPPGIYWIFALAFSFFGQSILSIRFASVLFVASTGFFISKIFETLAPRQSQLFLVFLGLTYIVFSSNFGGESSNTEIFSNFFTVLSAYLFVKYSKHKYALYFLFAAGILAGFAFTIKFTCLFLIVFLPLVYILLFHGQIQLQTKAKWLFAYAAGGFIWVGFVLGYFYQKGELSTLYEHVVVANGRHGKSTLSSIQVVLDFFANFLSVYLLFLIPTLLLLNRKIKDFDLVSKFLLWWLLLAILGIVLPRKFYDHYLIELLPAFVLILGAWLARQNLTVNKATLTMVLIPVFGIILNGNLEGMTNKLLHFRKYKHPFAADEKFQFASFLKANYPLDSGLYFVEYGLIYHNILHVKPLTRYSYSPFLFNKHFINVANIDPATEVNKIFAQRPLIVVSSDTSLALRWKTKQWDSTTVTTIDANIKSSYRLDTVYNAEHFVYRLRH